MNADVAKRIQALFRKFDEDGNGKIGVSEIHKMFSSFSPRLTEEEIARAVWQIDSNHDGSIDYAEFVAWLQGTKFKKGALKEVESAVQTVEKNAKELMMKIPFALAFSVTSTGSIKEWDLRTGRELFCLGMRSPSRKWRATTVESDRMLEDLARADKAPHYGDVNCISVCFVKRQFITAAGDYTLKLWDFEGHVLQTYRGSRSVVMCADINFERSEMISGDLSSQLCCWSLKESTPLVRFPCEENTAVRPPVRCVKVDWESGIALCAVGKNLQLWDIKSSSRCPPRRFEGHEDEVIALIVDWKNKIAISGSSDRTLRRWYLSFKTGRLLETFVGVGVNTCITWGPEEMSFVTGDEAGCIRVWNAKSGDCLSTMDGHEDQVLCLSDVNLDCVVSSSRDGTLRIWNLKTQECLRRIPVATVCLGTWVVGVAAMPIKDERASSARVERCLKRSPRRRRIESAELEELGDALPGIAELEELGDALPGIVQIE
eukprot:TRINITY_DN6067_c0_g1_i1.p1 TRINITY_DN6067_c0_g1~~TRINITY_DN6067_c0_g1_i1.p1  ORF type:complete len:488 (-),score=73.98 TRINITY_DN6067_c0_g1_i1:25-1488(-)